MNDDNPKNSLSYKDAGVDIDAGNDLVNKIKPIAAQTQRPGVMGGIGAFGALFELPVQNYQHPVLVSSTDGVGTKIKLAMTMDIHNTIGIDLVAMCVNDIVVQGAEPLFFLDYYATSKLHLNVATDIISGIAEGCKQAGCALAGGETAEMPGIYQLEEYDLAGFAVGVVEKDRILDGKKSVNKGDVLIGLASSGPHSNGYSLIRKIIDICETDLLDRFGSRNLGETLLAPTRIYVKPLLALLEQTKVHGLCHITGGGLTENLPRVLPDNCRAVIDSSSWKRPPIFRWIQENGNVTDEEMYRTFNCGVGMVAIVPADQVESSIALLSEQGETAFAIGEIQACAAGDEQVVIN